MTFFPPVSVNIFSHIAIFFYWWGLTLRQLCLFSLPIKMKNKKKSPYMRFTRKLGLENKERYAQEYFFGEQDGQLEEEICWVDLGGGWGWGGGWMCKILPPVKSDSRLCSQTRCVTVAWHKAIYGMQSNDKDIQKRNVKFYYTSQNWMVVLVLYLQMPIFTVLGTSTIVVQAYTNTTNRLVVQSKHPFWSQMTWSLDILYVWDQDDRRLFLFCLPFTFRKQN